MAPRLKVTLRALNNGNMTGLSPKITVCRLGHIGFKSMPVVPSPGQILTHGAGEQGDKR